VLHYATVTRPFGLVGNSTICQSVFVHYEHFMIEAFAIIWTFMRLVKNIELLLKCLEIPLYIFQESIVF